MTARGIANNNPGNIRRNGIEWQGMAAKQTDPSFVVFTDPAWGIRAIAKILLSYSEHGLDTVREFVSRWAPPGENDTIAYVTAVSKALNVNPDSRIEIRSSGTMLGFVQAIIRHENGSQPYPLAVIADGVQRALKSPTEA